ncbi:centromere protein O-like [Asterias rubens]|uniref:centromere protein O-like n=1 Tax=Asterias rubens TaxID=7604 RepID=UPI0014555ED8|nr:centromere protein O-like [Asterias rubens]
MNDLKSLNRLTKGTLHSLQQLENITHDTLDEREIVAKQQRQLDALHKTLQQLVQQHDRLTYKLKHGPCQVLNELLCNEDGTIEVTTEAQHAAATSSVAFAKRLKALEFVQAYRLSGVTVTTVSDKRIRLRWDTFYSAEYYEPYYMELEFKGQLQVYRHTLPYFMPVADIAERWLNDDMRHFVDEIGDMLNAFVSRRQQVNKLKRDHKKCIHEDMTHNQSFNCVQLTLLPSNKRTSSVYIEIFYDDLKTALPTRVQLKDDDGKRTASEMRQIESSFQKHELSLALSSTLCRH